MSDRLTNATSATATGRGMSPRVDPAGDEAVRYADDIAEPVGNPESSTSGDPRAGSGPLLAIGAVPPEARVHVVAGLEALVCPHDLEAAALWASS